jgi:FtsP/CotA-like multicopper oxidase with cupredoxin domain
MTAGAARISRRALLQGGAALGAVTLTRCKSVSSTARSSGPTRLPEVRLGPNELVLNASERPLLLPGQEKPVAAWIYGETPFPVFRARVGETVKARLVNGLREHTTIHWHGLRIPNAMDGVPYVTQTPVLPGEDFLYEFALPDPGLFFFHPHCNTAEQFGRGLAGVLLVDDETDSGFDDDILCALRDWRVDGEGGFLPFITTDGAGRAGSFGDLRTTNLCIAPEMDVPAGADIRLRIVNLDPTRNGEIGLSGADAAVISIDGNAVEPFPFSSWRLGPAMRLELRLRTPSDGGVVRLFDYFAAEPVLLAAFTARGPNRRTVDFQPNALSAVRFPEPDLSNATLHELELSASAIATQYADIAPIVLPDGRTINLLDSLCTSSQTLWAIDGRTWPEQGHENAPPPILRFAQGETAYIEFFNSSRFPHPMHLHGHTFKVLSASELERPVHWADTVLVMPDERVRIAFVADNPGNWMLHCHIIEHQETGMMAWFEVY